MQTPVQKFGRVAITLHWCVAACVLFALILGLVASDVDDSGATTLVLSVHKSFGITIFILALARLAWRLTHPAPPLPAAMPLWQRLAAFTTHALLYTAILTMPVTGYIAVAARGRETTFFGLFEVPNWAPLDRILSNTAQSVHDASQYVLYALLAAHVGAAAYHHFILKDGIAARMWPRRKADPPQAAAPIH